MTIVARKRIEIKTFPGIRSRLMNIYRYKTAKTGESNIPKHNPIFFRGCSEIVLTGNLLAFIFLFK